MRKILSKFIFFITGWKIVGQRHYPSKCIVIAAPHTSNWDFFYLKCFGYIAGVHARYLIKSEFFRPIIGMFFKWTGGIPVYRDTKHNLVSQINSMYEKNDEFILALTPEGTRSRVMRWKTGFYYIAKRSKVPIMLLKLDYKMKEIGVVDQIIPSDDIEKDFSHIQNIFKDVVGKIPENYNSSIF